MIGRRTASTLLLAGLALACRSREEQLVDRRHDLRGTLDALYTAYGGSDLANEVRTEAERERDDDARVAGVVSRIFSEVDRSYFEGYCLAIGRGERPFSLSGKLEAFMKVPRNADACRKAARIQFEIDTLERDLARR